MRYVAIVGLLSVGLLLPMTAGAVDDPQLGAVTGSEFQGVRLDCPGTVCWSQLPTWTNGGSSQDEVYPNNDPGLCPLISETADDFPGGVCPPITAIRFWGVALVAFTDCPDMAVRFFFDGGGVPGALNCETIGPAACELVTGYPGIPSYEHCVVLAEPCNMPNGGWVECQALYCRGLTGLGQWYWAVSPVANGSEVMFRSSFFGFPNWVPGSSAFGDYYDASFELLSGMTPTEETSWGSIKTMYR
ncbi:MAG: hypothetical protein ABIK65_07115 [Candidatus Eisenbacteria bacterium]